MFHRRRRCSILIGRSRKTFQQSHGGSQQALIPRDHRHASIGSAHEYAEIDDFSALLKFASGMHATLASSADASWLFPFERVEVFCHHATIATREMETLIYSEALDGRHVEHSMQQLSKEEKWGYLQEDRAFIDSILDQTAPAVTAMDGYKSVELVEAVYESVRTGEKILFGTSETGSLEA